VKFAAIAGREVRRQLTSPTSWLIVGLFALVAGAAFVGTLNAFLDRSDQALVERPLQPINLNQLLIRPFLVQVGIAALLALPPVTARAFTEHTPGVRVEPLPANREIPVAVFFGTFAVYLVMLVPSLLLVALLLLYGTPEWGSIASGYLGLLLIGAAFISAALVVSSLATSTVAAGIATFAISLLLASATWLARSRTPAARPFFRYLSVGGPLDDFAKGVLDPGHIVACMSVIALGLFLMHRTVAPRAASEAM
jgi:ABC-2 type transport system permease protein